MYMERTRQGNGKSMVDTILFVLFELPVLLVKLWSCILFLFSY